MEREEIKSEVLRPDRGRGRRRVERDSDLRDETG